MSVQITNGCIIPQNSHSKSQQLDETKFDGNLQAKGSMNKSQTSKKPFPQLKIWAILSIVVGIVIYFLALEFFPKSYTIKEISLNGRGGECPEFGVYDRTGLVHTVYIDIVSYTGPAPLYYLPPEKINAKEIFYGCYEFPEQIQPSTVLDGITFYPLDVKISLPNDSWIGAGASTTLLVDVKFSNYFSANSFAIPISQVEERETTFELNATNFEFSPKNENIPPAPLSLILPIQQQWIIAPKANALGEQYLGVSVIVDKHILPIIAKIDVRPLYGLNPTLLAVIAAFGTGTIGFLTILSQSLGIWEKFGQLRNQNVKLNKNSSNTKNNKVSTSLYTNKTPKRNEDPWNSLPYRKSKIQQAKERELLERRLKKKK